MNKKLAGENFELVGLGNALVDITYEVDNYFLEDNGLFKGRMTLHEPDEITELTAPLKRIDYQAGGASANTMVTFARLGGKACFVGRVAQDEAGELFRASMEESGVYFSGHICDKGVTGRCAVMVTPDANRTLATSLGVASQFNKEDIEKGLPEKIDTLYLEGYLYDTPEAKKAFERASNLVKGRGGKVALNLSDISCVQRHARDFHSLINDHVDILIANEFEVCALFDIPSLKEIPPLLHECCTISCVTMSEKGAIIATGGHTLHIPADRQGKTIDTTGAGDNWAAGFLYGLSRGKSFGEAGKIASILGGEVVCHFGAYPEKDLSTLLKERLPLLKN